jgi:hypothetical protein
MVLIGILLALMSAFTGAYVVWLIVSRKAKRPVASRPPLIRRRASPPEPEATPESPPASRTTQEETTTPIFESMDALIDSLALPQTMERQLRHTLLRARTNVTRSRAGWTTTTTTVTTGPQAAPTPTAPEPAPAPTPPATTLFDHLLEEDETNKRAGIQSGSGSSTAKPKDTQ